jgi:hypothetical protein
MTWLIRNYCQSGFGIFVIRKVFINNGFYEFENVDGSPYLNHINYEKFKKVLDM